MKFLGAIFLSVTLAAASPSPSQGRVPDAAADMKCPRPKGFSGGPYVPDAKTAETIYRAVAVTILPAALADYPRVVVEDKGDHWSVGQARDEPKNALKLGEIPVSAGGGQISMKIDKCSGAISHAIPSR